MVSSLSDALFVSCPPGPNSPPKKKNKGEKSAAGRIRTCDERYGMAQLARGHCKQTQKGRERQRDGQKRGREIRPRRKAQMRCCEHYGQEEEEEEVLVGSCLLALLPHSNALESNSFGGKKKIVSFLEKKNDLIKCLV